MRPIYVFDLDGTLVDSMPSFSKGILSLLDEEGISYSPELIKIVTALGNRKTAELYVREYGSGELLTRLSNELKKK